MATWPAKNTYLAGEVYTATRANEIGNALNQLPFQAGKNKIINGGFDVWQRGTSSSSYGGYYTADRWFVGGGGTVTFSQSTDVPTGIGVQYSLKWLTGASSSFGQYYTALEQAVVKPLRNKLMIFSYYIKSSSSHTGNILTQVTYSNSTDSLTSVVTAVTITGDTMYAANTVNNWTRKTVYFTVPNDAVGLRLAVLPDTVQASGISEQITGVQLEIYGDTGYNVTPTASPYAPNSATYQGELAACQRYYMRLTSANLYGNYALGYSAGTTGANITHYLPVMMRANGPTSIDYSTLRLQDGLSSYTVSSLVLSDSSTQVAVTYATSTGLTLGRAYNIGNNNSVSGYIGFSAEL